MYIMLEYLCGKCGERLESLEKRSSPAEFLVCCNAPAPRVLSAITGRVKRGEATQGKNDPPPDNVISTQALADGMPRSEWNKKRREKVKKARTDYIRSKI